LARDAYAELGVEQDRTQMGAPKIGAAPQRRPEVIGQAARSFVSSD
jgi:hypothetical protein